MITLNLSLLTLGAVSILFGNAQAQSQATGCDIKKAYDETIRDVFFQPVPQTRAGKCLYECMFRVGGLLKEGGLVNVSKIRQLLHAEKTLEPYPYYKIRKISRAIHRCKEHSHSSGDKCETAGLFVKCSAEEAINEGMDTVVISNAIRDIYFKLPQELIKEEDDENRVTWAAVAKWFGDAKPVGCNITKARDDLLDDAFYQPVPKTMAGKCIHSCMFRVAGLWDRDGFVDVRKMVQLLLAKKTRDPHPYYEIRKIKLAVDRCGERSPSGDKCETAAQFIQCSSEEAVKEGLDARAITWAIRDIYFKLPEELRAEAVEGKGTFIFFDRVWDYFVDVIEKSNESK